MRTVRETCRTNPCPEGAVRHPFAGRTPTRWDVVVTDLRDGRRVVFRYVGKPSRMVVLRFLKIMKRVKGYGLFVELDRGDALCRGFGVWEENWVARRIRFSPVWMYYYDARVRSVLQEFM